MSSSEAKNLEAISKAIDHHNATCEYPAVAVAMNPFEVERLGWDSIRGLPIRADGALAGGLGVSGAASAVDRACAEAGLRAGGLEVPE